MKAVKHRAHRSNRGIFLFELSLLTPIVIVAAISLVDVTRLLRTKNALKEASQAAIRCLTTEGSACTTTTERASLSRLYNYYRQATPPPLFGNMKQVPVQISERVSPLQRYQFDATVLDTVYTGARQTQYQEVPLRHEVKKEVPFVREEFPYFVKQTNPGNYDIFRDASGGVTAEPVQEITSFEGDVTGEREQLITFKIGRPSNLKGFGIGDICSRSNIIDRGAAPTPCLLTRSGSVLLSSMMLVLEGNASGGTSGASEAAQLEISASYSIGNSSSTNNLDLGGQRFILNGNERAEDFLPRGAPIGQVDQALSGKQEFIDHGAEKVMLPFDTDIKLRIAFAKKPSAPDAAWKPIKLRVFIPNFTKNKAELSCTNTPSCAELSSQGPATCTTTPALNPRHATLNIVKSTAVPSNPPKLSGCVTTSANAPESQRFSVNGQTCTDIRFEPATSSTCSPQITRYPCSAANKGVTIPPSGTGIIRASPGALTTACGATTSTSDAVLPSGTTLAVGEALATTKTVRVMAAPGVPAESSSWQQSCDGNREKDRVSMPDAALSYQQVTPILVGTIESQLQSLPPQSSSTTQQSLSCLPTRELSPRLHTALYSSLLGDYRYLLSPHPDKGCSYSEILTGAKQLVEKDPRYQATVGSPTVAGRFEFPEGTQPDACTPFTVGTSSVKKESLRLIGTFPETAPPSECSDGTCVREFVGFSGSTSTEAPGVNLQQAVSEAEAAALAYLPTRSREDLTVTITPPSRSTIGPKTYQITTVMEVPLSIGTKSTITHVAHGQMEG